MWSSSDKRRVLFVIPRMGGGGAERVVSILSNCFAQHGISVCIGTFVSDKSFYLLDESINLESAMYSVDRHNTMSTLMSMGKNFFGVISFVRSIIAKYKPDVVFSVLPEADIVTFLANRGLNRKLHICSERSDPTKRNRFMQLCLMHVYKRCDAFVCQSDTISRYYAYISSKKRYIIPNPIDISLLPSPIAERIPHRIVAVGRLDSKKNLEMLICSFADISKELDDVSLTVYGEGPERGRLELLIQKLGLFGRVSLAGAVSNVHNKIRDAALFVMSSDYEGFPNALVEAIALGIPVISTDFFTGVARELIDCTVGIVIPVGDQMALTRAMRELLTDDQRRLKIRQTGRNAVSHLETGLVINKWLLLLSQLLGGIE